MKQIEILFEDKNKLTVAKDRITLRIHRLNSMSLLTIEELQSFCKLVSESVVHKNTLRGKITYKNGLLKSKLLINREYGRDGFTIVYDVEKRNLSVLSINE